MSSNVVYAIVKAGGRQEKVSVGDVVVVDKLAEEIGSSIELQPLMLVDGDAITVDAAKLDKVSVKAEVVDSAKGPKISIIKYKNKSGYRKRRAVASSGVIEPDAAPAPLVIELPARAEAAASAAPTHSTDDILLPEASEQPRAKRRRRVVSTGIVDAGYR